MFDYSGTDVFKDQPMAWEVAVNNCVHDGGYMAPLEKYPQTSKYLYHLTCVYRQ